MTVAELLNRISSRELSEWMAFYRLEPFGEYRADLRAAIIAQTNANLHRDPKNPPYKLDQFIIDFDYSVQEEPREQTMEEQILILKALTRS